LSGRIASILWGLPALLIGAGGLSFSLPLAAQATGPAALAADTVALEFLGFGPGITIPELRTRATQLGKGTLDCKRAAADLRLSECRAGLPELDAGRSVDLWVSVIDGRAAITTLSARLPDARFARWREFLEGRYGAVPEKRQGPMRMMQWVHQGRMLRLSWRPKGRDFETSVSMVDGPLLDGWANAGKKARS
jgi:hypothetical protein